MRTTLLIVMGIGTLAAIVAFAGFVMQHEYVYAGGMVCCGVINFDGFLDVLNGKSED